MAFEFGSYTSSSRRPIPEGHTQSPSCLLLQPVHRSISQEAITRAISSNQKGHVAHAARAPAAAMSTSHATMRLTSIIKYKYSTLPPVDFVDKVNSYGQEFGKEIRGKRERERERSSKDICDCIGFESMLESVCIQQQTTFFIRYLGCFPSWSSEGLDVVAGRFYRRLVV